MSDKDLGRVPIVSRDLGKLVGIVARKDLLLVRARAQAQERDRVAMLGRATRRAR